MIDNLQTLVVIGNGMVGHYFLTEFVNSPVSQRYKIITFCEEPYFAYDRVHLSDFFTKSNPNALSLVEDDFFERHHITIHLNDRVVHIDREMQIVISNQGIIVHYDKLILATGSYALVPTVQGHDRPYCFVYRTLQDLEDIKSAARHSRIGVVMGGGLLGLEAAKALKDLGLETHIVQYAPYLMEMQLDETGARLLEQKIEQLGIRVHTNKQTTALVQGTRTVNRLQFSDGTLLDADVVIFSVGIRARDELARDCDLRVGERGGIVINNNCLTDDAAIYAIGECALWNNIGYGLVAPGYAMARTVIAHLSGNRYVSFRGADTSTQLKLLGVDVASIGDSLAKTPSALIYSYLNTEQGIYKRLIVSSDKLYLLGAILVGDATNYAVLHHYYFNYLELPANPDSFILPHYEKENSILNIIDLPNNAQICSCLNISKGQIITAIEEGCNTVELLKDKIQVGMRCGGCIRSVELLLE